MTDTSSTTDAVTINQVSKKFRLYQERNQTLKSTIMRGRYAVHKDFWALRDVSFSIPIGSTFGLIGRNGSGKSTLLRCIAKIYSPNSGTIKSKGRVAALLEVGTGFHQELSGRENIFLNGSILGMSSKEIKRRLDEIIEFSGVENFIDQPVKNYSSGMFVRLGFAIAINVDPDILLVDEVLAVGDAEFQEKCERKFVEFKKSGKTVILVSHAMQTVGAMCDQVALLESGTLKQVGDSKAVIRTYLESRPKDAN
ncbi:MAG: ABC transporter ATP-binding protein [Cryobacterium sp.]|nr:ABC transporter ATP-binding protein [Cryobacterium sp.]